MKLNLQTNTMMIALDPVEEKIGSLYVTGAHSAWRSGTVVNVGPGRYNKETSRRDPSNYAVGNRVIILNGVGTKVPRNYTEDDSDCVILCDQDAVIAIIED